MTVLELKTGISVKVVAVDAVHFVVVVVAWHIVILRS